MSEDSLLKPGITEAKLQAQKERQWAIRSAEKAVIRAAKQWFDTRPPSQLATAPIALAVLELRMLEQERDVT